MPTAGTTVKYCDASGNFKSAQVVSDQGSSITIDVYADGGTWADGTPAGVVVRRFSGIVAGSGVGQYQTTGLTTMGALAGASDLAAVNSQLQSVSAFTTDADFGNIALQTAIAALPTNSSVAASIANALAAVPAANTRVALPVAGTAVTLALNTARNPSSARSDSRSTRVRISGTWSATVTSSGIVELRSDSSSTPTIKRDDQQPAVTLALGVGITIPWSLEYDVPAGDSYLIATSGTGTFSITHINETVQ